MKKFLFTAVLLFSLSAYAGDKVKLTGVIGDEKCGLKANQPDHAACAKKCIKGGSKAVLVVGDKIYVISNPEKIKNFIGDKVEVTGETAGEVISIETISKKAE
jgi:hypothetical protein